MKRSEKFVLLLSIGLLVSMGAGCGSVVPIQDVNDAVFVPELVGRWQGISPGDEKGQMLVVKFDDKAYYVELREAGTEPYDKDVLRLRAYISEVDGRVFINAQNIDTLDESERLYFFYTYTLSPDGVLTLTELRDVNGQDIDKFETSEALYAFIRQNMDNEALYGDSMRLMKVQETGS